jgi:hypothetical protein
MKTMNFYKTLAIITMVIFSYSAYSQATFVNDNCILTLPVGSKLVLTGNLTNQNGGEIANSGEIFVSGNWANTGVGPVGDGTVYFNGTTQNVSGNTTFNYVNVNSGSTTTMTSGTQGVRSIIKSDGTLNANGHLTLLSSATGTGLITADGTGTINGTVTQQRFIPGAKVKGYKHYSSAFSDATFAQFGSFMTLALGNITDVPYPTIFKFSETAATPFFGNGWVAAAPQGATGNTIDIATGYTVQMGTATGIDKLTALSGTVNNGNVNLTITRNNPTSSAGNGWNLVGNPYPSPLDLHPLALTGGGINKSISIFISTSMYNGFYGYYNAGIGAGLALNGGSRILPALHGFFVQSNVAGPGTLTFTNAMRTNTLNPTQYKNEDFNTDVPFIKLAASLNAPNSIADETAIVFMNDATMGMDADYDASKIMNTETTIPNFFSTNYNENYAINALPDNFNETSVIPLGFDVQTTGEYTINALEILNFNPNVSIYLEDLAKNKLQDLNINPTYSFTANQGDQATGRFFIRFAPAATDITDNSQDEIYRAWASGNNLFVSYNNPDGLTGKIRIMNVLGQEIMQQQTIANGMHQFTIMQPAGYYLVSFTNENSAKTTKVFINK